MERTPAGRQSVPQATVSGLAGIMKYFYWCIAAALVVTVLAVLFVPGVDDLVERTFQGYVGRAAR